MFYKLAAMWSSQEGSLLLWAFVLSVVASLALYSTRHKLREIVPWATGVMMTIGAFFIGLMLFAPDVNPFHTLNPAPKDGIGLNPLLQHPSMMIHPPMLYSGYVAWTVPFAFAIGALITRKVDSEWLRATRRFALIAWTFLGFGLLLGARWSYSELGWGGYWAWDPVENAALMPFLLGTAFLHSIMVQEKRSMLKVWNATLIVATFSMCLLGTFLVRSGVLQSIHAFGNDTVGPYLLVVIGIVVIGSTFLLISRLDDLKSEKRIDSLASRESIFLINNLLLVGMTIVIAWGTFFPLISELFTGTKSSLAAPWFDQYTTPLAILLVLFTGVGPLLAWRRVTWSSARRVFRIPIAIAVAHLRRPAGLHRRRPQALGAGALHLRRLRDRRRPAGVLQRRPRPPEDLGRQLRRRPRRGHRAQPAPLRRLHRPHRHRRPADRDRRLLELPDQRKRVDETGRNAGRRRARIHLQASLRPGRQREVHLRRRSRSQGKRQVPDDAANQPPLLPPDRRRRDRRQSPTTSTARRPPRSA